VVLATALPLASQAALILNVGDHDVSGSSPTIKERLSIAAPKAVPRPGVSGKDAQLFAGTRSPKSCGAERPAFIAENEPSIG